MSNRKGWNLSNLSHGSTASNNSNNTSNRSTPTTEQPPALPYENNSLEVTSTSPVNNNAVTIVNNNHASPTNGRHYQFFKNSRTSPHRNEAKELCKCYPSLNNQHLPAFVDFCVGMVEEHGIDFVGIYRVPGNNAAVASLQKRFDSIRNSYDVALKTSLIDSKNSRCDVAAYTSALKQFFRTLPDPLFPFDVYSAFLEANRIKTSSDRMLALKKQIQKLPKWNYETMRFLMAHLNKLSLNSDTNKMDVRNLAIIFGPTLMRRPLSSGSGNNSNNNNNNSKKPLFSSSNNFNASQMTPHDMKTNAVETLDQCLIVQTVITHHTWFFDGNQSSTDVPDDVSMDDTSASNSPGLQLVFNRLNTSLSMKEAKSIDESVGTSGSRSSPQLRTPTVRSLVKSEPNIPAKLIAEEQEENAGKLLTANGTGPSKHGKSVFGRKLKMVRNIFRKTSSEIKRFGNKHSASEFGGDGSSHHTPASLSLSMTSPSHSDNNSKLNSFDRSSSPVIGRHSQIIANSDSISFPPSTGLNHKVRLNSASSASDFARSDLNDNSISNNNNNDNTIRTSDKVPPRVPPRKHLSLLTTPAQSTLVG